MFILAGDVGGTKTRLGLFKVHNSKPELLVEERFDSKAASNFGALVLSFLSKHPQKPQSACFGIPGPVIEGRVRLANLPWELHDKEIAGQLGLNSVLLLNDLAAFAAAIPLLDANNVTLLHPGTEPRNKSMFAVVAPGTGLGQAYLQLDGTTPRVFPTEGGHVNFSPSSELEIGLLKYLQKKFKRVSIERVVCGPGLVNIFEYLKSLGSFPISPSLIERTSNSDIAAVVTASALANQDEICVAALNLFMSVLGSHVGDVILSTLCTGGVYLAGGIPPKIAPKLQESVFLASVWNKGRFQNLVESTPLYLIRDDRIAMFGAASLALAATHKP
jgi:glucokinase